MPPLKGLSHFLESEYGVGSVFKAFRVCHDWNCVPYSVMGLGDGTLGGD
jgi:hypothetical protein